MNSSLRMEKEEQLKVLRPVDKCTTVIHKSHKQPQSNSGESVTGEA